MKHTKILVTNAVMLLLLCAVATNYVFAEGTEATATEVPVTTETNTENQSEVTTQAVGATTEAEKEVPQKKKAKFVKKGKKTYLLDENGKKKTGIVTDGKRTLYITKKGKIKKGWVKKKNHYYYFDRKTGDMKKGCKVDDVKLNKDGEAILKGQTKDHIENMIKARKLVEGWTNEKDNKAVKRKKVFDAVMKWQYVRHAAAFSPKTQEYKTKGWQIKYGKMALDAKNGDCVSVSCAMAYMFKECGYKTVYVGTDSGHAWVELGGRVYDNLFAEAKSYSTYYGGTYSAAKVCPVARRRV